MKLVKGVKISRKRRLRGFFEISLTCRSVNSAIKLLQTCYGEQNIGTIFKQCLKNVEKILNNACV